MPRGWRELNFFGARRFFDAMRKAGIEANAMTYSSLLNVCAKAGDYRREPFWPSKGLRIDSR